MDFWLFNTNDAVFTDNSFNDDRQHLSNPKSHVRWTNYHIGTYISQLKANHSSGYIVTYCFLRIIHMGFQIA